MNVCLLFWDQCKPTVVTGPAQPSLRTAADSWSHTNASVPAALRTNSCRGKEQTDIFNLLPLPTPLPADGAGNHLPKHWNDHKLVKNCYVVMFVRTVKASPCSCFDVAGVSWMNGHGVNTLTLGVSGVIRDALKQTLLAFSAGPTWGADALGHSIHSSTFSTIPASCVTRHCQNTGTRHVMSIKIVLLYFVFFTFS